MSSVNFDVETPEPARAAETGRFEFRCWPGETGALLPYLYRNWSLADCERRADIYLLSAQSLMHLVKLRDGTRLEIKTLAGTMDPLQYWCVEYAEEFPLPRKDLDTIAVKLGVPGPVPPTGCLTPGHLIAALNENGAAMLPVTVGKIRALFLRGSRQTEITHVRFRETHFVSVAFENRDPDILLDAIDELGLGGFVNEHYGEFLLNRVARRRLGGARSKL